MPPPEPRSTEPESSDPGERRRALRELTRSIRRLCDASVSTKIDPAEIDSITSQIDGLRVALAEKTHDGPYSGLMGRQPDFSDPHEMLPLSPIIGPFNPVAPDVALRFEGERVHGEVVLGKKHVGPPGCGHGGVSALIADQLVALAGAAAGVRGVTRSLTIRFRRPVPLFETLELEAWCRERSDDQAIVAAEIRCGGKVRVEIEGEMVSARGITHPTERRSDPVPRG